MQHFTKLDDLNLENSWVSIGSFDGVHLGHQHIIRMMVMSAHQQRANAVVLTFFPHPAVFFRDVTQPYYLTLPDERAALLADLGVDVTCTLEFNRDISGLTAEAFLSLLTDHLDMRRLWVGSDFALGKNRQGDIPALHSLADKTGFVLNVVPQVSFGGNKISSSFIRQLLEQGQVAQAKDQLGYFYFLNGLVVHGDARGKQLGVPTANLEVNPMRLVPAKGVYATRAIVEDKAFLSVTNIGFRPTFDNPVPRSRIETHLLDDQMDLYGRELRLEFHHFIRPEKRFDSVDDLISQIKMDINFTRETLG